MLITNDQIKELLEEKSKLIELGRGLNNDIEQKSLPLVKQYLSDRGIEESGTIKTPETETETEKDVVLYKGSYQALKTAFSTESLIDLNDLVEKELDSEITEIKKLEAQVVKINEQISQLVKLEVLPTLQLGEFEYIGRIELRGIDIYLEIIDAVEDYKKKYLASRGK